MQGLFIGEDQNNLANLVCYADKEKIQKHRPMKFTNRTTIEKETQTHWSHIEYHDREVFDRGLDIEINDDGKIKEASNQNVQSNVSESEGE